MGILQLVGNPGTLCTCSRLVFIAILAFITSRLAEAGVDSMVLLTSLQSKL